MMGEVGDGVGDSIEIEGAGDMEELELVWEQSRCLAANVIEFACALAAAGDEDGGFVGVEAEGCGGCLPSWQGEDFRSDGSASLDALAAREELGSVGEAKEYL